jgi:hypothetical protein
MLQAFGRNYLRGVLFLLSKHNKTVQLFSISISRHVVTCVRLTDSPRRGTSYAAAAAEPAAHSLT